MRIFVIWQQYAAHHIFLSLSNITEKAKFEINTCHWKVWLKTLAQHISSVLMAYKLAYRIIWVVIFTTFTFHIFRINDYVTSHDIKGPIPISILLYWLPYVFAHWLQVLFHHATKLFTQLTKIFYCLLNISS